MSISRSNVTKHRVYIKYLTYIYTELIASDIKRTNAPYFMNFKNSMGCPFDAAVSLTMTFAAAPIIVRFPPKHAPKDNAHHRACMFPVREFGFEGFMSSPINGAIVAV